MSETPEIQYRKADDGDYLIPDLEIPNWEINIWGRMRYDYLKENQPRTFTRMECLGTLYEHLHHISMAASARLDLIMDRMERQDPPPDNNEDYLGYVQHMNSLRESAEEIIRAELIYPEEQGN